MTTPIIYPPGQISVWGQQEALLNQSTWISYIGVDGSIFYLTGPLCPLAGAQDGLVLLKHQGLMAPFDMLELKGARQDGATWQDALYDPGEIMFLLEASGTSTGGTLSNSNTPQRIRNVMRQWVSAWDPKETGILSVFTPDMGEWWCLARLGKNITDEFAKDYTWSGKQRFTWNIKNYDAFWMSVDSTCRFGLPYALESVDFETAANAPTLGASWNQVYSTTTLGTYGIQNGAAVWIPAGSGTASVINIFNTPSTTNNQVVQFTFSKPNLQNLWDSFLTGATVNLYARLNSAGTQGVVLSIGFLTYSLQYFSGGTTTTLFTLPHLTPLWGERFTLIAGTINDITGLTGNPYRFIIQRNNAIVMDYTDTAGVTPFGSSNQNWGFGASINTTSTTIVPPPIAIWNANDNVVSAGSASGFVNLTNIGDQDVWPRYLLYGPGNFSIGNGPGSTNMITFGPLYTGQIVLLDTDPAVRNVVDLTPNQPPQTLTLFQKLLQQLISFATNNNTPPLLRQFENKFGIRAPQGNLYSLLNGRFTNPIPGSPYGTPPPTQQINVAITNGGPTTQIIAACTPLRRWPL